MSEASIYAFADARLTKFLCDVSIEGVPLGMIPVGLYHLHRVKDQSATSWCACGSGAS